MDRGRGGGGSDVVVIRHKRDGRSMRVEEALSREETAKRNLLMVLERKRDGRLAGIWAQDAGSCWKMEMRVHKGNGSAKCARGRENGK